jgi:hypothetical protein
MQRITLRRVLGAIWLLDGLLQLQPGMWTMDMVVNIMKPGVSGQPPAIQALLNWAIQIAGFHVDLVNATVAAVQLVLGVALLAGWSPRAALAASMVWSLVIWTFGESLGALLTGQALFLTGAPGAVLLYGFLAVLAWPVDGRPQVAGWVRYALGVLWLLAAALQFQPAYLNANGLRQALGTMVLGQPALLARSISWAAHVAAGRGMAAAWLLGGLQLALAAGLFFARNVRPWLATGMVWCALCWWFGQAMGMILSGMGTDPNTAPLVVLFALAAWPAPAARGRRIGARQVA